jgi:general secretion pathway protein D
VITVERSKLVIAVIIGVVAVFIVWKVGFYKRDAKPVEKGAEPQKQVSEPNKSAEVPKPAEANEPMVARDERAGRRDFDEPQQRMGPFDPNRSFGRDRFSGRGRQFGSGMRFDPNRPGMPFDPNRIGMRFDPNRPGMPFDPNRPGPPQIAGFQPPFGAFPGEPNAMSEMAKQEGMRSALDANKPAGPNEPMEALNLKDVEMKSIIQKLAEWTGKVIIPTSEAMSQKVTIYSSQKLPRSQALAHIYSALRMKGYSAEVMDNAIYITTMKEAKLGFVPTIPAGQPLALLENKDQIVQKFFKMENYKPSQMSEVVRPLVGEHGYVSADETTSTLLIIDTVSNLMRIERIIMEFDVPESEQTVTKVFTVENGDPSEIVQLLRLLLGVTETRGARSGSSRGGGQDNRSGMSPEMPRPVSSEGGQKRPDSGTGMATSVVTGQAQGLVVLIPEPRRKWIIARASAEAMKQIDEWIKRLDMKEPVESEYEVISLRYANPSEVEQSIEDTMRNMPGMELMPSIMIEPLEKQVLVAGRKDLRDIVKKLIEEIDLPPGLFQTEHIRLKYADPDQVKTNIEELYSDETQSSSSRYGYGFGGYNPFGGRRTSQSTDMNKVKVISYVSLRQVTVIASPENMVKIIQQIAEWDKPLDVNEVRPRIIELHNSDPVEMADLLKTLFSETSTSGRTSFFEMMFGTSTEKQKIVGALYGQLTFEEVPGTKKIIVISKIAEAYDVVEQLILDLDKQEMGEIPKVITLKYADPEDLGERLNAMFNQPGTSAPIRRSAQGLSSTSTTSQSSSNQSSSSSSQSSGTGTTGSSSTTTYTPPWSGQGARTTTGEEMPISNVIGKVRFVPETHSKSLLVLAPPEFMPNIEALVQELDIPGKQVMVKAVIIEVKHSDVTSLGLQLASNPSAFGNLEENSMTALNTLKLLESHGASLTGGTLNVGNRGEITTTASITALIDFLVKKVNAKILNQQTLWTKDNGEAIFFKGDNVALQTAASVSGTTGMTTSSYEFNRVGMTLRVRPRITPEKNVDMVLNIILSQLTSEQVNLQPKRTEMETTTNMIVQNGETVMLGGILFQEDSKIERKLPLLGDIPLAGWLFRHNEVEQSNNELIVFVTPYVIDEGQKVSPEASEEMAQPMERLKEVQEHLKATAEQLEQPLQKEKD